MQQYPDIDTYIADYPKPVQQLLQQMRSTIHKAVPQAEEAISYGMPTFKYYGNLVHFAAFKQHIGLYPGASGVANFTEALKPYNTSKGAIQFPMDEKLPLDLVKQIVLFRVKEAEEKAVLKNAKKLSAKTINKTPALTKNKTVPATKTKAPAAAIKASTTTPFATLGAPAQRALANAGINTLKQLAKHSEASLLQLHGMGPASLPKLKALLQDAGLSFTSKTAAR